MSITDAINCACDDTTGYRTLLQLRQDLLRLAGYGAQVANPPPGVADEFTAFLQLAQTLTITRLSAAIRLKRWFSWSLTAGEALYDLPDNDEATALITPTGLASSTATTGGSLVAATYSYRVAARNRNGTTLACAADTQIVPAGTATNTVTLTWTAVPGALTYDVFGRAGGTELLLANIDAEDSPTWTDTGSLTPAGALPAANTTACAKVLDPYAILQVGYEIDGRWRRLTQGIPLGVRGSEVTGPPQFYEIRQCIELWPAPAATEGYLVVEANFQAGAFSADGDKPSVDDTAVFLLALANLLAARGRPEAGNYVQQYERRVRDLVAGSHGTRRYVPGHRESMFEADPVPATPFP